MRILVLGGSSFSGRSFIALSRAEGHEVFDLSRPDFDLNNNLPSRAGRLVVKGWDRAVNFIALNVVAASWNKAPDYYQTNVVGIAQLCEELMESGKLKKFVQVSTPEVYGNTGVFLREGAPFNPSTPYAVSRAAADMHLRLLHRQHGFPVSFTRTVNVYGKGQQAYRIIPKTIACIREGKKLPLEGGGVSTRSFIHIRDAASAYLRVLEDGKDGEDYHIARPVQISIRDLVREICEKLGADFDQVVESAPERPGKDMNYQLDDAKIRRELGWEDSISLDQGLDEMIGETVASV